MEEIEMLNKIRQAIPIYGGLIFAAFMLTWCIKGVCKDLYAMNTVEAATSNDTYTITVYTSDGTIVGVYGDVTDYEDYKYQRVGAYGAVYAPDNYIAFMSGNKYYQYYNCCVEVVRNQ